MIRNYHKMLDNLIKINYVSHYSNYIRNTKYDFTNKKFLNIDVFNNSLSIDLAYQFLYNFDPTDITVDFLPYQCSFLLSFIKLLSNYNLKELYKIFNHDNKLKKFNKKLLIYLKEDVEQHNKELKNNISFINETKIDRKYFNDIEKLKLTVNDSKDNFGLFLALAIGSLSNELKDLEKLIYISYKFSRFISINFLKNLVFINICIFTFLANYKMDKIKWCMFFINLLNDGTIDNIIISEIDELDKKSYYQNKMMLILMWMKFYNIVIEPNDTFILSIVPYININLINNCFITSYEESLANDFIYYGWSSDQLILLAYLHILNINPDNWFSLISQTCLSNQDMINVSLVTSYWYLSINNINKIHYNLKFKEGNKLLDFTEVIKYKKFIDRFVLKYKNN